MPGAKNPQPFEEFVPQNYMNRIVEGVGEILKVEANGKEVVPEKVWAERRQPSVAEYNKAKTSGRGWKSPIYANISVRDSATGKVLSKKDKLLVGYVPDITPLGSFLVQGNDYYVPTQFRIKPGVYTRERNDGMLEAWMNTAKGRSMKIIFDPDKEDFKVGIAGKTIPLFPVLHEMVPENQLREWFGDKLAISLAKKYQSEAKKRTALSKFHEATHGEPETDYVLAASKIKEYWGAREGALDPDSVESMLGVKADKVSPTIIGLSARKILDVFRGEDTSDDRDNLTFKSALAYDSLVPMRLFTPSITTNIKRKLKSRLGRKDDVREVIPVGLVTDPINRFFLSNGGSLALSSDQTNLVSMFNITKKTTILGEGSISSTDAVVDSARDLHPTKIGIIDPVFTPESSKVGVVEHKARGAVYDTKKKKLVTTMWDRKKGKEVLVEPGAAIKHGVSFRDQFNKKGKGFEAKNKNIWAYDGDQLRRMKADDVRYIFHKPENLFSQTTNMVPFLTANSGPRLMMASKMMEQAVPLIREEREAPLVEAVTEEGVTFADQIVNPPGREPVISKSPVEGTVRSISDNSITVADSKGKKHIVELYKNHPLTAKTFIMSEPLVEKGQKVKKGQLLADVNFTKDGRMAIGKNLTVAYMPFMGYTLDDGVVVSASAARKMTSEHLYRIEVPIDRNTVIDKKKFRSSFPDILTDEEAKKYDDYGIIREGEILDPEELLALPIRKATPGEVSDIYTRINRRGDGYIDASMPWDKTHQGKVVKVNRTPHSVEVHIKTTEPVEVGDKLSGRHGNKGIVTAVISDSDMPKNKAGDSVDMIIDPVSVPGRANLGQIFEVAAAKVAEYDGKPYQVYNFKEGMNFFKDLTAELKKRGLNDKEMLYGPDGKEYGEIATGPQYILKLQHRVASKMSARDRAGYDLDRNPLHGGSEAGKAKGVDRMLLYALLASGARANLQEMSILKGTKNEEYWRALESGDPVPPLKVPFSMEKMMAYLNAAGVNVSKEGTSLKLVPLTDTETLSLSSGKITTPKMLRAKDLKEEKGGLFDTVITGGIEGKRFGHMTLAETMPNPIFEKAIASVLQIREKDVQDIVSGRVGIQKDGTITTEPLKGTTGGEAIKRALAGVNPEKDLKEVQEGLEKLDVDKNADRVNKLNRRARYLRNLRDLNIGADKAFTMKHLPVIPPIFRPVYPLPSGDIQTSDINYLYRNVGILSDQLTQAKEMTSVERNASREAVYDALKTFSGLTAPKYGRPLKGAMEYIAGSGAPKHGYFQRKVLRKEQDMSGRSVITPNPELGPDEARLPKDMAWKIYRPLIIKSMVEQGFTPSDASTEVDAQTDMARKSLDIAMAKHPVLLNRAPTLHKFSVMAFRPKIWSGKTIQVPHLVAKGYNMDFDGDEMSVFVPATAKAAKESSALMPTANLFNPGSLDIMVAPSLSTIYGLYHGTKPVGKKKGSFSQVSSLRTALDSGKVDINSEISFGGKKTTPGSVMLNELFPEKLRDYSKPFDIGKVKDILRSIAGENTSDYGRVVSGMKGLGDKWATYSGLTIGLEDIKPISGKETVFKKARQQSTTIANTIAAGRAVDKVAKRMVAGAGLDSSVMKMLKSGALSKGKTSQVKQMIFAPVMAQNYRRQPIPMLIESSYSEGLKPSEYWAASFGARAGMMDRALSTSLPGAFAKEVLAASINTVITIKDCLTKNGIQKGIDDTYISGRLLAKAAGNTARNTILDGPTIRVLKSSGIKTVTVRSPITCEAEKGICQKCYGLGESGTYSEVGENIGALSGTTITEPITQMAMTGFHTAGVVEGGGGILTGSPRIFQLLRLPNFVAGAATVSRKSGKVDSIEETEAGRVKIDIGGSIHYAQPGIALKVKKGDSVKKGEPITGGLINPRDIIETKGIKDFRTFLADELSAVYKDQNKEIDPRHFEVVARTLSSQGFIKDPGSSDFIKGDMAPITVIEKQNIGLDKKIEFDPFLRGVNTAPMVNADWLARMGYQQIRKAVQEGAASGWSSEVGEQGHPIASYVYGTEFFKGDSPALTRVNAMWTKLPKA